MRLAGWLRGWLAGWLAGLEHDGNAQHCSAKSDIAVFSSPSRAVSRRKEAKCKPRTPFKGTRRAGRPAGRADLRLAQGRRRERGQQSPEGGRWLQKAARLHGRGGRQKSGGDREQPELWLARRGGGRLRLRC